MIFRRFSLGGCAVLAVTAVVVLAGCSPGMSAAIDSLKLAALSGRGPDTAKLDPEFAYLRITRGRQVVLFWRGLIERTGEGPVEIYYSGEGEVLRLRDGRLVGVSGLPTEWTAVTDRAPAWSALVNAGKPVAFVRVRDVMPGYRSGLRDELTLTRIAAPERSALQAVDPQTLAWFEERMRGRHSAADALPPARYALDLSGTQPVVVYSEQCVAGDFCFTWQRWSTAMQQASAQPR